MTTEHDTIIKAFLAHVEKMPDRTVFTQPMGGGDANVMHWTFEEALTETTKIAAYLESKNYPKGSSIAICSKNCAWWVIADFAIWMSGHVTVPIYPTLTGDTVKFILEHSDSKLLFVGKLDEHPWNEMKGGVSASIDKVSFPLCPPGEWGDKWDEIIAKQEPIQNPVERTPDEMATIIYTSGSTGCPKGVMQSFKAMTVATIGISKLLHISPNDRYLSYLPLAHGMERWLGECVAIYNGVHIFYAEDLKTFVADLVRCHPTIFVSVPRLWTKFQQGVFSKMPPKKLNFLMSIPIISYLVRKKILKGLGLDAVRFAGSGSAPIPAEMLLWYRRLGLELLEGYGMTENFNYSHLNKPGRVRVGYVGEPYDDVQQRLSDDGEIQIKSPGNMMGYYKNDEATKESFTDDGWLRTGDRGEIDNMNRLKITGRTKEIFKTSKGKYVAPAPIENELIAHDKVELACVGGIGFPQPHAVIQLGEAAKKAAEDEKERAAIEKELEQLVKDVNATVDPHEALDFVCVIKEEWQPENGFLTPTQKIVRATIEKAYEGQLEGWHKAKKSVLWYGW